MKTTANTEFIVSQHNFDCAYTPTGKQIKHSFDF